jgi:hypothetical protein
MLIRKHQQRQQLNEEAVVRLPGYPLTTSFFDVLLWQKEVDRGSRIYANVDSFDVQNAVQT